MTLRLRLVLALVTLVAAGLVVFGVTTYTLYAHSQYRTLDNQIQNSRVFVEHQLDDQAGFGNGAGPGGGPRGPIEVPAGTYAELRTSGGTVVSTYLTGSAQPKLPPSLPAATSRPRWLTVGAASGSTQFRVYIDRANDPSAPSPGPGDSRGRPGAFPTGSQTTLNQTDTIVIAAPLTQVSGALHRLVLDETGGAIILLMLLSAGSWMVLRRGLRPLELMAGTARSITAGDLSQRVSPSGGVGEVGQLGLALNTMLDDIEAAFQEREATEQRLRQFLADASHELRTPLTSIQGFAELFRLGGDNARVDLPTILRRIEQESARMKVLVEDLLLLARLDQTRVPERSPVDLAVLAADACSDAVATAPDRRVTLDAPEPVVVSGDQAHLRQAIANLVTNAVHHTPAGTPIEVRAALVDGWAMVSVRDHGLGLDEEGMAHVFDRFWRADQARVGTGAGLGLAIVASIAHEHGGTASAANATNGGAVFTVRLPLSGSADMVSAATDRPLGRSDPPTPRRGRVTVPHA